MQTATAVRRGIYKAIFGKLLERFKRAEKRISTLEKANASLEKTTAALRRAAADNAAQGANPAAARVAEEASIQAAQLATLLRLKGLLPAIPPGHLQFRVSGAYSPNFFAQGNDLLDNIETILRKEGRALSSFESVLDFGCGCGRILIPLMFRVDPSRLSGCDIDPEAIEWCKKNLPSCAGFGLNPPLPPMTFADDQFDLIYGVSVFTHLPEEMQFKWLAELYRVTKPGGYALMTFHGEPHYPALPPSAREKLDAHGFFYTDALKGSTAGLPDFYQTSWHTHPYVRKHWGAQFEVVDIVASGIANHDVAVLRKPT